jgi:TRAP transporter TAXI family solute receptor
MKSKVLVAGLTVSLAALFAAGCASGEQGSTTEPAAQTTDAPEGVAGTETSDDAQAAADAPDRSAQFITMLSGPTSGVYYPVGDAFAAVLAKAGYKTSTTATGATAENIKNLLSGDGEIAIAMSDAVIQAYNGTDAFEGNDPATSLRSIMGLWPNVCQIVTTEESGIKSFADLKGKRVGVGAPNSGVEVNARMMFAAHGMTYDDATVDYLDYGEAIDQIKNGQMDAAFVTSAIGNATIKELAVTNNIAFVPVEAEALATLTSENPYYVEWTIPADAYGTDSDITTAAVMNILLTTSDLDPAVVQDMLELFYSDEGLASIQGSHNTAAENISLDTATRGIAGIDVPLHDGAIAFYESKGIPVE